MALLPDEVLVIGAGIPGHIDGVGVRVGLPNGLHHGQAVLPGHFYIRDDQIRQDLIKRPGTRASVRGGNDLFVVPAQYGLYDGKNDARIIDNENFHAWLLPCADRFAACQPLT